MAKYSVSKINAFKQCKKLYKLKYIDKLVSDKKPFALEKGDLIHRLIEYSLKTSKKPDISDFSYNKEILNEEDVKKCVEIHNHFCSSNQFKVIKSLPFKKYVEQKFWLNKRLEPSEEESGLFSGKIDFFVIDPDKKIGLNIDWKTGR